MSSDISKKDAEKRIKKLREEIRHHDYLYYVKNEPEISDKKYDLLMKELKDLEEKFPDLLSNDSPTQRVGGTPAEQFETVEHVKTLLSLDSATELKTVKDFDDRVKRELNVDSVKYIVEPKLDGLSLELIYENGKYVQGSTRGDGRFGENITDNVKTIRAVPLKLFYKNDSIPKFLAVRGEGIMYLSDFENFNKTLIKEGKNPMANPRNAAAGALRRLDPNETAKRPLDIFFYEIINYEDDDIDVKSQSDSLDFLKKWGLKTNPHVKLCEDIDEAIKYHDELEDKREELGYEIDGVVIKVNDLSCQKKMGVKSRSPRWAVAYKFPPRKEETRIMDIVVQVGRRGTLTPVALLKPVDVQGVTVSRATLHNMDYIEEKDIKKGDWVKIVRAGDVIPEVVSVDKKKRTGEEKDFEMLDRCPICDSKVIKEGAFFRCMGGLSCKAQLKRGIQHFSSRQAMDIDGLGGKTVGLLVDQGIIERMSDIYRLKKEDLVGLERWADKSSENLIDAIKESKKQSLARFIYALGIPEVGQHTAQLLAEKYHTIDNLMKAELDNLLEIHEIGPEIAKNIVSFFNEEHNVKEINDFKNLSLILKHEKTSGKLEGKRFVFTGSLNDFTRGKAKEKVQKLGAETTSSVSKKVDFVVVGEKPGGKLDQAKELGIEILDEKKFKKLIS